MKRKGSLFLVPLVLLLIVVVLWWCSSKRSIPDSRKTQSEQAASSIHSKNVDEKPFPKVSLTESKTDDQSNMQMIGKIYGSAISFYGKVVDLDGNPVAGATIYYDANDKYFKDGSKYESASDVNGFFSITGIKGSSILVGVLKEGYDPMGKYSSGGFSPVVVPPEKHAEMMKPPYKDGYDTPYPTPEQPALFLLRKKGKAEILIQGSSLYGFSVDGTPHYINLQTGEKNLDGRAVSDLVISVTRPSDADRNGKYFWLVSFRATEGGILATDEQFPVLAPENGYQPVLEFKSDPNDPQWANFLEKSFYLKCREGKYAKIKAAIHPFYQESSAIRLEYYYNPSGSRNLEFDPAKSVSPKQIKSIGLQKTIEEVKRKANP